MIQATTKTNETSYKNTRSKNPNLVVDYDELERIQKMNRAMKAKNDDHDSEGSFDTHDDDDSDSHASWEWDYNEEEVEYLKSLADNERDELRQAEKLLLEQRAQKVPLRFRILSNTMLNDGVKHLIIKKLNSINDMDDEEQAKQLQWVESLNMVPFGVYKESNIKMDDGIQRIAQHMHSVKKTLDESIYGHQPSKVQILEYITQYITNPKSHGKCLALQGPPGNGKTTLIRNGLCKAMDRPFIHISLGGMSDVNILNGMDFTYIGSKCGRIVQGLQETGVMNPIFYFDELDKVSNGPKGEDIYSYLCHLVDFSQNKDYHDNYFSGITFDLSKAIFIFSFNDITAINPILLDRLRVIETSGFNTQEKMKIAKGYLIKQILGELGMSETDVVFSDDVLHHIASMFSLEAGVRKLRQALETIISRLNMLRMTVVDETTQTEATTTETHTQLELPYHIQDLRFPFHPTIENITTLLTGYNNVRDTSFLNMYT